MSRLGELCLKTLVSLRERLVSNRPTSSDKDSFESYFLWQFRTSESLFARYPNFNPVGCSILEIGCGTGGRAAWLASVGASRVVGIDINQEEIQIAQEMSGRHFPSLVEAASPVLEFHASQESAPLDIGTFDYVLLVDAMEHVVSPPTILRLAHSYTKDGGKCYFSTLGWYHHNGTHMPLIPWSNLFFSDETIINVMRWKLSQPRYKASRFDSSNPLERWRGVYDLRDRPGEHLNKITISEIKRLCRYTIFRSASWQVIGFGSGRPFTRMLNMFKDIPLIQEICHSGIVVELLK